MFRPFRSSALLLSLSLALLPRMAASQTVPAYTFVDLGTLRGHSTVVTGINNAGQICGWGYYDATTSAYPYNYNARAFRITHLDTDNDSVPDTWNVPNASGDNTLM